MAEAIADFPPLVGDANSEKLSISISEVAKEYQDQVIYLLGIYGEFRDKNPEFLREGADVLVRKVNRVVHKTIEKGIPIIPTHSNQLEGRPTYIEVWKGGKGLIPMGVLKPDRKPLAAEIKRLSEIKTK